MRAFLSHATCESFIQGSDGALNRCVLLLSLPSLATGRLPTLRAIERVRGPRRRRGARRGVETPTHAIDRAPLPPTRLLPHEEQPYLRSARRSARVCAWKPARIGVTLRDDPQFWQCRKYNRDVGSRVSDVCGDFGTSGRSRTPQYIF